VGPPSRTEVCRSSALFFRAQDNKSHTRAELGRSQMDSVLDLIDLSHVGDFASTNGSESIRRQRNCRERLAVQRHELDLKTGTGVNEYDCAYVSGLETKVRKVVGKHHCFVFANHWAFSFRGYTVTRLGRIMAVLK
jgi:hypothetical protein